MSTKSEIVKKFSKDHGIPIIDIKVSDAAMLNLPEIKMIDEINPFREIQIGDHVLMEYAKGVVEHVYIKEIADGMAYGVGDDGEEFCAPLDHCDKVPF